jgi:hypothetical protein
MCNHYHYNASDELVKDWAEQIREKTGFRLDLGCLAEMINEEINETLDHIMMDPDFLDDYAIFDGVIWIISAREADGEDITKWEEVAL